MSGTKLDPIDRKILAELQPGPPAHWLWMTGDQQDEGD